MADTHNRGHIVNLKTTIINEIIETEGGYVDDPDDSGGATKYGITEPVARAFGYTGSMADLPRDLAFEIYARKYWAPLFGDALERMSEAVAREVVDMGVNTGTARATVFLQRALNVFNDRQRLYADLKVDGYLGPVTLRALGEYLAHRSEGVLVRALNCLQGAKYIELAERREKDERFVYGWLKNRVIV